MATLLKSDGQRVPGVAPAGERFTGEELCAHVGCPAGYLQAVPLDKGRIMWIHEEGKLRRLPTNLPATVVATRFIREGDHIVGDALVTDAGEVD